MRRTLCLAAMAMALFIGKPAFAEVISFIGKTYSPDHMEVMSPHATPEELKIFDAMAKEVKDKRGEDAEPPVKPFTGRMKVSKMLADIGQHVDSDQRLLEYAFPPEDLLSEERKLSQADLRGMEANLESLRSDIATKRKKLEEARMRYAKGAASQQEMSDIIKDMELARLKERILDDNLRMEREMAKGELELAKAKFGPKASAHNLPGQSWITSPVAGYVLWVNPEVKPGMILTKKTKLFVVGSMDPILVRALVHEIQLAKLRVGDKATIAFDTMPGKTYEATIIRIPMTANQTDVQLPSHFEVELSLPNPGLTLKEGMRGQVSVQVPDGPR
ncbi:efflux RND transporter periplasmic adaptor subunit [Fundidesulfovibrio terrae]|uniref:efflux RND transporter periplasmic adaptor subunit n=1 Tax=Fundidesulfovibrio terrae TaxID=2922866 RepID=UPI001FAEE93E|nr:efflux RND transporter periplasmic adaptor subunit [Fundidesulfovibrio terrae]